MRVLEEPSSAPSGASDAARTEAASGAAVVAAAVVNERGARAPDATGVSIPLAACEPVSSLAVQETVIARLSGMNVQVSSPPAPPMRCEVLHAVDRRIRLRWDDPDAALPAPQTVVEVSCALHDGMYMLRGKAVRLSATDVVVQFGNEVWRVQRRENFRVPVPARTGLSYRIRTSNDRSLSTDYVAPVLDVGARGAALRWPVAIHVPEPGERFSGVLCLQSRQVFAFDITVRRVQPLPDGMRVGVEFVGLPRAEQHRLSMLCFELERAQRQVRRDRAMTVPSMNRLPSWFYAMLPALYVTSGCMALCSQEESGIARLCAVLLVLTGALVSRLRRGQRSGNGNPGGGKVSGDGARRAEHASARVGW